MASILLKANYENFSKDALMQSATESNLKDEISFEHSSVEAAIKFAVGLGNAGSIDAAAEHLVQFARQASQTQRVRALLAAAQMIDSTNPNKARRLLEQVISEDQACGPGHLGLSVVLSNLGEGLESVRSLDRALKCHLTPSQKILAALMLSKNQLLDLANQISKSAFYELNRPLGHASNCLDIALQVADWDFVEELVTILRKAHDRSLVAEANEATKTNILWCADERVNIEVARQWSKRSYPYCNKSIKPISPMVNRPVRIGYLSSDYRNHPTSWLINGLFRNHDRERFELFIYCSGWDDGSEIRQKVYENFKKDHQYSVASLDDRDAASLIASHDLDILVELNGPTKANRMGILAHRPAPIQISYLGWPGSCGGRFVDYIIGDEYIIPEQAAELYPEKILWTNIPYQVNDYKSRTLPKAATRQDLGLPEDKVVLGVFNSINKVRREVWTAWMEILRSAPNSILWLLDPGEAARSNLATETKRLGIDLDRIVIAPKLGQAEHLARLQQCDLMLDSWPVGGHTSTADALFARVPLLVMCGTSYSSRVSGTLIKAAGLEGLIVDSIDEYVAMGATLCKSPNELKNLKSIINYAIMETPVFDSTLKTKEIEALYMAALDQKHAGM